MRRRRLSGAGLGIVLVAVAVAVASTTSPGPGRSAIHSPSTNVVASAHIGDAVELTARTSGTVVAPGSQSAADEAAVAKAEEEFSLQILQQLATGSATSDSNQLISPFSLSEALAMTLLAARGDTASQIAHVLHVGKISSDEQAEGWNALDTDVVKAAVDDHLSLRDANSIWTQTGFPVKSAFLSALNREFGAGVWQTNFAHSPTAAVASINAWVSQATKGLIPSLLNSGDTPSSTAAVLLNAVLFEAQWATQLTSTTTAPFYSPGGTEQTTFLSPPAALSGFKASVGDGLDAVELPFWNGSFDHMPGRFAALIVMPTKGSLAQFIGSLNVSGLDKIVNGLADKQIGLEVPQIKVDSDLQLAPALEAMGMPIAFGAAADLSGFSSVATQISEVKQQATLSVTKWGTVAAAATAVVIEPTDAAILTPVNIDRPFLFLIRDTKTGAILFESAVNNPAAGS
jgi:serpin B